MSLIVLTAPHTHAGRDYPAGHPLDVPAHTAQWLLKAGVAVIATQRKRPPQATEDTAHLTLAERAKAAPDHITPGAKP